MRLTAILAVRNEELYIRRCCEHLVEQGVEFAIIDNCSTDETWAIAESYRGRGLVRLESYPYPGYYDWTGLLRRKQRLAQEIDSDWCLHLDADEIPEASNRGDSLVDGFAKAQAAGFSAVNFDEFVFLPESVNERYEHTDYVREMNFYYYFAPKPHRLIRGWRKTTAPVDLASSGGHRVSFSGRRVDPVNLVLRHYIALSFEHLQEKYLHRRVYAPAELDKGWHGWRARQTRTSLRLPPPDELCDLRDSAEWDRSRPQTSHLVAD